MHDRTKEIFDKYSTPGLRRKELSRWEKREHLARLKVNKDEIDTILVQLYGPEDEQKS